MIQQTDISWQTQSWQSLLQSAVTDVAELCRILDLDSSDLQLSPLAQREFPLRVPMPFVNRMERGNPKDPLLLQVLAVEQEMIEEPGLSKDPLQEAAQNPLPGLLHKYRNRVLLTVAASCAIHCRYCFRRHFDYQANNKGRSAWPAILGYLNEHPEVDEVILSGGDPLMADDDYLKSLTEKIAGIRHIKRLRIHTRLPVVIPQRILQSDLQWLGNFAHPIVVLHINHAREIDEELTLAVTQLRQAGATVLNQAVLLAGINDNLKAQLDLHRRSFDSGILPYYLHLPDQVRGTAHFQVDERRARALMQQMQAEVSGYMLPNLVMEQPGKSGKTRLL
jgi:L-lysine 2,3-aminomutase